jgi:hypothetical protein
MDAVIYGWMGGWRSRPLSLVMYRVFDFDHRARVMVDNFDGSKEQCAAGTLSWTFADDQNGRRGSFR